MSLLILSLIFDHASGGFLLILVPVHFSLKGGKKKGRLYLRRIDIWVVPDQLLDSLDVFLFLYRGNRTCVFSNVIDGNLIFPLRYLRAPQGTNSPPLPQPFYTCFPSRFLSNWVVLVAPNLLLNGQYSFVPFQNLYSPQIVCEHAPSR